MKKQFKYTSLVAAGAVTLGLVGGTLAWFTSTHDVTNTFKTIANQKPEDGLNTGVHIHEKFEQGSVVTPGLLVNKDVWVENTASYDQFIRVKLTPEFKDNTLNNEYITLIPQNVTKTPTEGSWYSDGEYYYYIGRLANKQITKELLDAVTLDASKVDNKYEDKEFTVKVDALSVQANSNAFAEVFNLKDTDAENDLYSALEKLQNDYVAPTTPTK